MIQQNAIKPTSGYLRTPADDRSFSPLEKELEVSVREYRGLTPSESETLANARVALAIALISRSEDVLARRTELLFLEVQLAYKLCTRRAMTNGTHSQTGIEWRD